MDRVPFPWTEEIKSAPEPQAIETLSASKNLYWTMTGCLVLVLILGAFYIRKEKAHSPVIHPVFDSITGVVSMLPLPKGSIVETATLKEAPLNLKSLTKTQKRQLVEPQDLLQLSGKLKVKKDIPPNRIMFWSDLEMIGSRIDKKTSRLIISRDEK